MNVLLILLVQLGVLQIYVGNAPHVGLKKGLKKGC